MIVKTKISLQPYNTFGIDVNAADFIEINSIEGLKFIIETFDLVNRHTLVIGGGSNILLTKNYDGLVLKMAILGIEKVNEDAEHVYIKAMAGEAWHQFVLYCVNNNYAGIENLSLIPGCVGAAPMQNIGAYGVEIKDTCYEIEAYDIANNKQKLFSNADCKFGYRESIFKHEAKGKYIITSVTFKLLKQAKVNVSYGAIQDVLRSKNIENPTIKNVSDAVISIRESKLPNPKVLGNAGSFFKNPEIPTEEYLSLKEKFPGQVHIYHSTLKYLHLLQSGGSKKEEMAAMLLAQIIINNPNGKILFSSSLQDHISSNMSLVKSYLIQPEIIHEYLSYNYQ